MQEIALFLTGIAGVATAAAYRRFPMNRQRLPVMGAKPGIHSKIHSLQIEKGILTKAISRLYQHDAGISKIQRDRLLSKYQHQLGIVLAKIEKLEDASKHPDMGPIGDGLITLMDQKLSVLDRRLYELSSKITAAGVQAPEAKREVPRGIISGEERRKEDELSRPADVTKFGAQERSSRPVELTTLTPISGVPPEFPALQKMVTKDVPVNAMPEGPKPGDKTQISQSHLAEFVKPDDAHSAGQGPQLPSQLPTPEPVPTGLMPKSAKLPDEDGDDDSDDLDRLMGEITKTLSKLEQAEVE